MKSCFLSLLAFILSGCDYLKPDTDIAFCESILEQKAKSIDTYSNEIIYLVGIEEIFTFPKCYDGKLISTNGAIKILPIDGSIWLFQDRDRARVESFNTAIATSIKHDDLINPNEAHFEDGIAIGSITGRFEWELEPLSVVRWLRFNDVIVMRIHERKGYETKEFDERLYYKDP